MQQVYFSHSYRDVSINSYFLDRFLREDIALWADQKTDVWCVAKLERYLLESSGFVSIIPSRASAEGQLVYSQYIGYELTLARRSRVHRLLFVDDLILNRYRSDFPEDAVPFVSDRPERDSNLHDESIRVFKQKLENASFPPIRPHSARLATLVVPERKILLHAADGVADILRSEGYEVRALKGQVLQKAFDDIRLLESLLSSEICVFVLGDRLSYANVTLAMAHAHCIPCMRLRYDCQATDCQPSLSGMIRWSSTDQLVMEFSRQLDSFRKDFKMPIEIAKSSNATEAARSVGTMQWSTEQEHTWDPMDGSALINHLKPEYSFVQDEVSRVRSQLGRSLGKDLSRRSSIEICRHLYDGIKRHRFIYEFEPQPILGQQQAIRTPNLIETHKCATCIDLACLFVSLLEAAYQQPIVVVLDGPGFAHALVGYRALDEPPWESEQGIGDLRGAITRGDLVLFEPTGAAEAERAIENESEKEHQEGEQMLDFMAAKEAAKSLLSKHDITVRYIADVCSLRKRSK